MRKITKKTIVEEDLLNIVLEPLKWEKLSGKIILITGASGFLPAYMVETLLLLNSIKSLDCKVLGLVRNIDKARKRFAHYESRQDLILLYGDISKPINYPLACDYIIHAASQASPKFFGTDPVGTMTANILGSYYLLELAKKWQTKEFLYFSSAEVYGNRFKDDTAIKEENYGYIDIIKTRSCYAESKRASETLGISYAHQYNMPFKIVRPFHTYGPGMDLADGRIFADLVSDVIHHRNLTLHSDGSAVRSFCYLSDAISGYFRVLLEGENSCAYNVGNPMSTLSMVSLANMLCDLFPERNLKTIFSKNKSSSYLTSGSSTIVPCIDLISKLGWKPNVSAKEGFLRTVISFEQNMR